MSKFESFQTKTQITSQTELFPTEFLQNNFMIVTISDLYSRIIPKYEKSKRGSLRFYNLLKSKKRIHVIDGPQVLQLLQETYRKSFLLPSDFCLPMAKPFIQMGNVYVGIIAGNGLKNLYDQFGNALFLENIREYLGPTSGKVKSTEKRRTVNAAIAETLQDQPNAFLARNNGITFRANSVTVIDETTLKLYDASIVNGCQTTISIVKNPQKDCHVLVKIVEVADSWDIAEAANFQNEIDQIALRLARFVRPQAIRTAASKSGVRFRSPEESSAFAVIDSIYQEEITEEEFRALFLGMFSSSPRNVISVNYTEVNIDTIDQLFKESNPDKDTVNEILFRINEITKEGAKVVDCNTSF
jgi:hypothetical protein